MLIDKICVRNFKALHDVSIEPGNVNIIIGPNGAGKSTILEAIGLLSIAMSERLDDVSLLRKGIRLSTPKMYCSNFKAVAKENSIRIQVELQNGCHSYTVSLEPPKGEEGWNFLGESVSGRNNATAVKEIRNDATVFNNSSSLYLNKDKEYDWFREAASIIGKYAVYQPSTPVLRGVMNDYAQIQPLGINGGRLAEAIEEILSEKDGEMFLGTEPLDDIYDLIDWADDFSISWPNKSNINQFVPSARRVIEFHDAYMNKNGKFTAYDASEGALYVLFTLCLLQHPKAPTVFAIDNFDQAMNPRLARAITKEICRMAVEKNKMVFLTTHNPMTLDGLNLNDSRIRLFTTQRSIRTGDVEIRRVEVNEALLDKNMPLSRLWTSGMIGGVPNI